MGRVKQSSALRRNRSSIAIQVVSRASPTPQLRMTRMSKHRFKHPRGPRPLREADRQQLAQIAYDTVSITQGGGSYTDVETQLTHDISYQVKSSIANTCVYASSSTGLIDNWRHGPRLQTVSPGHETQIKFVRASSLKGARDLSQSLKDCQDEGGVGFLNCSSAKRPGGGFLNGGTEQEECLARASTLHASLASQAAATFYRAHKHDDAAGFYDHQLIYTPYVVVLRSDRRPGDHVETGGGPLIPPFYLSVVSSCAINVQQLRGLYQRNMAKKEMNQGIEDVMRSRMARILRVFEERGIRNLLLGAFGTGQPFHNNVETVARIWAELIACPSSVFKRVFDRVWFAMDTAQFQKFETAFESRVLEEELTIALQTEDRDPESKPGYEQS